MVTGMWGLKCGDWDVGTGMWGLGCGDWDVWIECKSCGDLLDKRCGDLR